MSRVRHNASCEPSVTPVGDARSHNEQRRDAGQALQARGGYSEGASACYVQHMPGAGFAVTKGARRITRIGGHLRALDKAIANRKNRRHTKQDLHARGADALLTPKLWTDYDVI
jgi:hypothetical protein